ncbi:hypothetical protein C8Q74DRAFT_1224953 [Fomes fomentarius]|nr:hypothetical protein C8Q74DRAFT_1224953 [Fomes fomentarius]
MTPFKLLHGLISAISHVTELQLVSGIDPESPEYQAAWRNIFSKANSLRVLHLVCLGPATVTGAFDTLVDARGPEDTFCTQLSKIKLASMALTPESEETTLQNCTSEGFVQFLRELGIDAVVTNPIKNSKPVPPPHRVS